MNKPSKSTAVKSTATITPAKPAKGPKAPSKPAAEAPVAKSYLASIPLALIDSTPNRDMNGDDGASLEGLAKSMKANGQISPVFLRKVGERYTMVAGRRRYAAASMLGWPSIDARIVEGGSDAKDDISAFVENWFRKSLSPYEACKELARMSDSGLTGAQISNDTGMAQSLVNSYIRVVKKCSELVLKALLEGRIGIKDAIGYSTHSHEKQNEALAKGLSAAALRALDPDPKAAEEKAKRDAEKASGVAAFKASKDAFKASLVQRFEGQLAEKAAAFCDAIADEKTLDLARAFLASLMGEDEAGDATEATEGTEAPGPTNGDGASLNLRANPVRPYHPWGALAGCVRKP